MKIKTSELTVIQINWVVATLEGHEPYTRKYYGNDNPHLVFIDDWNTARYATDWAQGGQIIEREKICLDEYNGWCAEIKGAPFHQTIMARQTGKTPLEAAMRCYVASKLGEEVEIPEELVGTK